MSPACPAPDAQLGTALRLSDFLNCNARLLGENGFQALAGNFAMSGTITVLMTILVALIGYRLLWGGPPDLREGMDWMIRLAVALALVTSWPAFQTLIYRVVVDGPTQVERIIAPSVGLTTGDYNERTQEAYDKLRLGESYRSGHSDQASEQEGQALVLLRPSPKVAATFLISTVGIVGALRLAIGFLLSIGPLAILALMFGATAGLTVGWVRALAGVALGLVGAQLVASFGLVFIEDEIDRLRALSTVASTETADVKALMSIVQLFALATIITVWMAIRVPARLDWRFPVRNMVRAPSTIHTSSDPAAPSMVYLAQPIPAPAGAPLPPTRITSTIDGVRSAARRDAEVAHGGSGAIFARNMQATQVASGGADASTIDQTTKAGTRSSLATSGMARQRDVKK
jgi:type IV secretion system protein VirB6